ncbi:hypothetical protein GCM10028792_20870 [Salinisphaera aquimarina]
MKHERARALDEQRGSGHKKGPARGRALVFAVGLANQQEQGAAATPDMQQQLLGIGSGELG